MYGRSAALQFLLIWVNSVAIAQEVRIGVLGLFHPRQITLSIVQAEAIVIKAEKNVFVLEADAGTSSARIKISGDALLLSFGGRVVRAVEIHAAGRDGRSAAFNLAIPGKISRQYRGTLTVRATDGIVVPIVTMDLETAVASVVQAESAPDAPLEALKAQAIVTRSYLVAGKGRHHQFDFCDLTHCQSMRESPKPESLAAISSSATRGLVILFAEKPIAAMFTRSCGGHTRAPAEISMPGNGYPYFPVVCAYCYKHPSRWRRRILRRDAELLLDKGEAGRLAIDGRLGWNAVPSNNFTSRNDGEDAILRGAGQGHGVGLCQRGAKAMAEGGSGFHEIISHYFPNTSLGGVQVSP